MTGVYAVVVGFHATLIRFFTFGPTNLVGVAAEHCQEAWWRNLIYINNLDMDPYVTKSHYRILINIDKIVYCSVWATLVISEPICKCFVSRHSCFCHSGSYWIKAK